MRVLVIGDVIGRTGRAAVGAVLPGLRRELELDLVIANGENLAGGLGITRETAEELVSYGVDVITTGNHVWDHREILPHLDSDLPIIRPLNYPPDTLGRGYIESDGALVVNLLGRVFIGIGDCPFRAVDHLIKEHRERPKVIIVDMHAEATSEKQAIGFYLDGRVSALVGTHTHIPTADTRVLPGGTAYVTDVGMVGAINSVIGVEIEDVLERFLKQTPKRLTVATEGPVRFDSVLIDVDDETGLATEIVRIDRELT